VDVVFEVASQRYPLEEQAATLMAENLRVKAAHEPGAEGTVGERLSPAAAWTTVNIAWPISCGISISEAAARAGVRTGWATKRMAKLREEIERLNH
jgi:hypothetical protein